jgi:hypothetical protein
MLHLKVYVRNIQAGADVTTTTSKCEYCRLLGLIEQEKCLSIRMCSFGLPAMHLQTFSEWL